MKKRDWDMALSVLNNIEISENTLHILIGISFAKEAVEKQIPKKPEYYGDGYSDGKLVYDYAKCPVCGRDDFEHGINNWGCNYCPDCGQALDWSDNR